MTEKLPLAIFHQTLLAPIAMTFLLVALPSPRAEATGVGNLTAQGQRENPAAVKTEQLLLEVQKTFSALSEHLSGSRPLEPSDHAVTVIRSMVDHLNNLKAVYADRLRSEQAALEQRLLELNALTVGAVDAPAGIYEAQMRRVNNERSAVLERIKKTQELITSIEAMK